MKLFYSRGACSFAPHVILRELNLDFELVTVDLPDQKYGKKNDEAFQSINPGGKIPALVLNDGRVLSQCSTILVYLADQKPELNLIPIQGSFERYQALSKLNFIASDFHKPIAWLFYPKHSKDYCEYQKTFLISAVEKIERDLEGRNWPYNERFSVIDIYLYIALEWIPNLDSVTIDLAKYPNIINYIERISKRESVVESEKVEANQFK
jgi:glutathione S-transferase